MGRRRNRGRPVDGIIVVNKYKGASSNEVLQQVKRLYGAAKAGHTGSLDPLATGVLPICLGEGTKFSQYLLDSDKSYRTVAKLGARTTTSDAEGEVVETREVNIDLDQIRDVLGRFTGVIEQVPSMFSALKVNGQPLYKLAREGKEIERPSRMIQIHAIRLLRFDNDELELEVDCSKGTYIRTLVEDIGNALGCLAYVADLHRIKAGPYHETRAYTLEELEAIRDGGGHQALDQILLPLDTSIDSWPAVELIEHAAYYLKNGQPVQVPQAPLSGMVRLYQQGEPKLFLGVGEITDDGLVAPRRLIRTGE